MKRITIFFLVLVFLLFSSNLFITEGLGEGTASDLNFTDELTLNANSCYLVNLDTTRVIYEKNAHERVAPASTTKIMTAALALSLCEDASSVIVTLPEDLWVEFENIDISHAGLAAGEEITMEQLVYCMLLQSANEAASGVASYFGRHEFIDLMNQKARELGCTDTNFTNPHGLYDVNHYTSARDLFLITEWAISVPGFYEIACKSWYTIPETNKNYEKTLVTSNLMQDSSSRYYTPYIRGIKTGTLEESGRCLVSIAEKNEMRFCLVLLGCPMEYTDIFWEEGNSVFSETRIIYDWLFDNAVLKEVVTTESIITQIPLNYSPKKDSLVLYSKDNLNALLRRNSGIAPVIQYETDIPESVDAPIEKGQTIGTAKVYVDDIYIGDISLISYEDVEFSWFLMLISKIGIVLKSKAAIITYISLTSLVLIYIVYIYIVMRRSKRKRR